MQVLTDRGFLFGDEIRALLSRGESIQFACFEKATQTLKYATGEYVEYEQHNEDILEFSIDSSTIGIRGAASFDSDICLRVTPEHRIYAQRCTLDDASSRSQPPAAAAAAEVYRAAELYLANICACTVDGCEHSRDAIRLQTCVPNGVAIDEVDRKRLELLLQTIDISLPSSSASASVHDPMDERFNAFLQLYGLWIACCANERDYEFRARNTREAEQIARTFEQFDLSYQRTSERNFILSLPSNWSTLFFDSSSLLPSPPSSSSLSDPRLASWTRWLTRDELRIVLDTAAAADVEEETVDQRSIIVASARLRDDLLVALLHAGYAPHSVVIENEQQTSSLWHLRWSAAPSSSPSSLDATHPLLSCSQSIRRTTYSGKVWCVKVAHADRLIVARRCEMIKSLGDNDHLNSAHLIRHASRPTIVGNCHNLGMSTNLKHDRLMKHCRVINGEICFNSKEVYNLSVLREMQREY